MLLPEEKSNKYKELTETAMQDYSPLIFVLESQNFTFHSKLYLIITREFIFLTCNPLYSTRFALCNCSLYLPQISAEKFY
jgi:hypothetical protein